MTFTALSQEKAGRKDTTNHPLFIPVPSIQMSKVKKQAMFHMWYQVGIDS
jgi:hypothetical protein